MKTTFKQNVLTINTEIAAKNFPGKTVSITNENGDDLYTVCKSDKAQISKKSITCNSVVDGCLAYQVILDSKTKKENLKETYGAELIEANKFIPQVASKVAANAAELDAVLESVETDTGTPEDILADAE